jgi:ribosomal protein S18 acetylase RimI-like enzyme
MKYRLANKADVEILASIHLDSAKKQAGGFMHKLGLPFLTAYYKIHVKEKNSVILVAEDESGTICGFVSGTLAAEKYLETLRKNRIKLALIVLPQLFKSRHGLITQLKARYDYVRLKYNSEQFGIISGPRIDYWAWRSTSKSNASIFLFKAWLNFVFAKGVTSVQGEVDLDNNNILLMLTQLGAKVIKELKLKDGRPRVIIEFVTNQSNEGYIVRNMAIADLDEVVEVHIHAFQGFFLTMLGRSFLHDLYKSFIDDPFSICLVAEKNLLVKGFVVGNLKPDKLFRKMLLKRGYLFLLHSLKALIRNPIIVSKRLTYALFYRGENPPGFARPALLSSIGVDPREAIKGVGSHLSDAFCKEAFSKGADVVCLTTDMIGNDQVNAFYAKNGFTLFDVIEKIKGRKMNRYIKLPDEKNI